jgi:Uma2 family endonuclease
MKLAVPREQQMSTSVEIEHEIEVEPSRRRFTVEEFQRMGEAGIFAPDERVELIDGEVIQMSPIGPRHIECMFALEDYLRPLMSPDRRISIQTPIQLADAQPQPDVALLRRDLPKGQLPPASACSLVVEIADSTVRFDRTSKRLDYARAGIPEYWVLDLPAQAVVVHLEPSQDDYRRVSEHRPGTSFISPALGGRKVAAADLLV